MRLVRLASAAQTLGHRETLGLVSPSGPCAGRRRAHRPPGRRVRRGRRRPGARPSRGTRRPRRRPRPPRWGPTRPQARRRGGPGRDGRGTGKGPWECVGTSCRWWWGQGFPYASVGRWYPRARDPRREDRMISCEPNGPGQGRHGRRALPRFVCPSATVRLPLTRAPGGAPRSSSQAVGANPHPPRRPRTGWRRRGRV